MTRAVGSNVCAARIASRLRGRFGSERALRSSSRCLHPSTLALVPGWRLSRKRGPRTEAGRGDRWHPRRGEGRSRPEPSRLPGRLDVERQLRVGTAAQPAGGGSYEEARPRARLGSVQPPEGRAIETIPASATTSERNRSKGQWRRAFVPNRCADERAPSGDRSEARRGRASAWNRRTDGRLPLGNRREVRRRSAASGMVARKVASLRRSGRKDGREGHRAELVHGRSDPVSGGIGRKRDGERHPPGTDARMAGSLLGIDGKCAGEAYRPERSPGRSHLFGGAAGRTGGKGTAWSWCTDGRIPFRRESVGSATAKGIRPELAARRVDSFPSRASTPAGIPWRWRHRCVPWQRSSSGKRIQHCREIRRRGRRTEAATVGLPEVARGREPWCDESGATRIRNTGCVVQAQRTPNASCDALAGAVVATSPVPTSWGQTVVSSLRLRRRRSVSALASRPPGSAGDR